MIQIFKSFSSVAVAAAILIAAAAVGLAANALLFALLSRVVRHGRRDMLRHFTRHGRLPGYALLALLGLLLAGPQVQMAPSAGVAFQPVGSSASAGGRAAALIS
ncbi:MAG: hypothetical protein ACOCZE_09980, partial [Planctomycetota bacterium]